MNDDIMLKRQGRVINWRGVVIKENSNYDVDDGVTLIIVRVNLVKIRLEGYYITLLAL